MLFYFQYFPGVPQNSFGMGLGDDNKAGWVTDDELKEIGQIIEIEREELVSPEHEVCVLHIWSFFLEMLSKKNISERAELCNYF